MPKTSPKKVKQLKVCQGITLDGGKCKRKISKGKFCFLHTKTKRILISPQKGGKPTEEQIKKLEEKLKKEGLEFKKTYNSFIDADPTNNKKYLSWIVQSYIDDGIKKEFSDIDIKLALQKYEILQDGLENNDPYRNINSICGMEGCTRGKKRIVGLIDFLNIHTETLKNILSKKSEKKVEKNIDYEIFADDEFVKIIVPKTRKASCKYGASTKWCTASNEATNWFKEYSKNGKLYIIIPKNPSYKGEKYQFHYNNATSRFSLKDVEDKPVNIFLPERNTFFLELLKYNIDKYYIYIFYEFIKFEVNNLDEDLYDYFNQYLQKYRKDISELFKNNFFSIEEIIDFESLINRNGKYSDDLKVFDRQISTLVNYGYDINGKNLSGLSYAELFYNNFKEEYDNLGDSLPYYKGILEIYKKYGAKF